MVFWVVVAGRFMHNCAGEANGRDLARFGVRRDLCVVCGVSLRFVPLTSRHRHTEIEDFAHTHADERSGDCEIDAEHTGNGKRE